MTQSPPSPFHDGERQLQGWIGARDRIEKIGRRLIRDYLPEEHRRFYAGLPWLLVGSLDRSGRPWASVLFGRPGFLRPIGAHHLDVTAQPLFGDPLNENLELGADVGLLGIELSTRRRNRLNGTVSLLEPGRFRVSVVQTFGNCPQYIQAREPVFLADIERTAEPRPIQKLRTLDARARDLISRSDTFFIATGLAGDTPGGPTGGDVSHRGGRPGFVRIDADDVLTIPDYRGNRFFNTLGNILLHPRSGLLFIDFEHRNLLFLTGAAEIIRDGPEVRSFRGAERLIRISVDEGVFVKRGMPLGWRFAGWSPSFAGTERSDDAGQP